MVFPTLEDEAFGTVALVWPTGALWAIMNLCTKARAWLSRKARESEAILDVYDPEKLGRNKTVVVLGLNRFLIHLLTVAQRWHMLAW